MFLKAPKLGLLAAEESSAPSSPWPWTLFLTLFFLPFFFSSMLAPLHPFPSIASAEFLWICLVRMVRKAVPQYSAFPLPMYSLSSPRQTFWSPYSAEHNCGLLSHEPILRAAAPALPESRSPWQRAFPPLYCAQKMAVGRKSSVSLWPNLGFYRRVEGRAGACFVMALRSSVWRTRCVLAFAF